MKSRFPIWNLLSYYVDMGNFMKVFCFYDMHSNKHNINQSSGTNANQPQKNQKSIRHKIISNNFFFLIKKVLHPYKISKTALR